MGYPVNLIQNQISKVHKITRLDLLYKKKDMIPSRHSIGDIRYKTPYHHENISFRRYVQKQWLSHIHDPQLKELFPSPPIPVITRNRNLKDLLVHTKFS